jgi:hypothetical protein
LSLFWLKQVSTSWAPVGGNRDGYFLWRDHVGIGAVENDMLLILDIISITPQVTGGGITLIPCRCLKT